MFRQWTAKISQPDSRKADADELLQQGILQQGIAEFDVGYDEAAATAPSAGIDACIKLFPL